MNRNRHNRPYERPGSSSNNGENDTSKGLFNHMKNSVSGLLRQSWIPSFLRYDAPTSNNTEAIERGPANESFLSTASTSIMPTYPEEGNSPGPSTSTKMPLTAFKLNNLENYKSNMLIPDPLVASTPTSSPQFVDRAVGTIDNTVTPNVSIIAPSITNEWDMSVPSTSQTPVQSTSNKNTTISKKRLRESFNDSSLQWSNSSFQNKSLPQASALSSKRPRFNASTYGTPVNTSGALADSSFSIFYPGKTMYGGAANYRKSRCLTPLKSLQRAQVKPQAALVDHTGNETDMSMAAKRIMDCLDSMTTPLSEAKKMPVEKGKVDYFDQPYVSDFHKHRPSLRTASPRIPPTSSLLTPSQTNTKENLASFLKNQGTPRPSSSVPFVAIEKRVSRGAPSVSVLPSTSSGVISPSKNTPVDSLFHLPSAKPVEPVRKPMLGKMKGAQDSFKITSKKGVPQFDDSPIEVPDLPNISLPVTNLPTISFGMADTFKPPPPSEKPQIAFPKPACNFKVSPNRSSGNTQADSFLFRVPEVLRQEGSSAKTGSSEATDAATSFVFSEPHSEKDTITFPVAVATAVKPSFSPTTTSAGGVLPLSNGIDCVVRNGSIPSGWGDTFKPASDSWECGTCCVRNKTSDVKCVACQTPNAKVAAAAGVGDIFATIPKKPTFPFGESGGNKPSAPIEAQIAPQVNGFGAMFGKKAGQWTCDACLVDNAKEHDTCVACMTAKPGSKPSVTGSAGFGGQFAMPKNDWECDVCLVRNKEANKKCLACGSLNPADKNIDPASEQVATGFTFGVPAKNDSSGFNFGGGKSAASETSGNFSFGCANASAPAIKPAAVGGESGTFKFGASTLPAKAASGAFDFGSNNTTDKDASGGASFSFGCKSTKSDNGDKGELKFGSKTAPSTTVGTEFKFGSNSTTKTASTDFSFGPAISSAKSATSNFSFASKSDRSDNGELKEPIGAKLSFASTTGRDKLLNSNATPTSNAINILSKIATVEPLKQLQPSPKLSGFELGATKSTGNKQPFDSFKKPAPVYDINKSSQSSAGDGNNASLSFVDPTSAAPPPKYGEQTFSNAEKVVTKSNMFTFGPTNDSAANGIGFNFNPKPSDKAASTFPSGLDLFSNKSTSKFPGSADKPLFAVQDKPSNSLKRPASELECGPPTTKSNMFSTSGGPVASKNMFSSSTGSSFLSNVKATEVETSVPAGVFAFGDATKTAPAAVSAFSFGGQETKKNSLFTFGGSEAIPKENNNNNTGFNFGQAEAPTSLNFSFGGPSNQSKPVGNESTPASSLFTFGNTNNSMQEVKPAPVMSFGQPVNDSSTNMSNSFSFGNAADPFKQPQPSFSIGTPNGDSAPMSAFGGPPTNLFNATSSTTGESKSNSRIIKRAVRRSRK